MTITSSESLNQHAGYSPSRAHDGNPNTHYSPQDGAMAGNFLKLYLKVEAGIGEVKMTSRGGWAYAQRMENTEVRVYCCGSERVEVKNCGKIIGRNFKVCVDNSNFNI